MNLPDGRPLTLSDGILLEPGSMEGRIVLWLPGESAGGFRHWDRVGSVPRAGVAVEHGVCATPAISIPARQRLGLGLWRSFRGPGGLRDGRTWTLPDGGVAEQCGARRSDLAIAWPEDETIGIDPGQIRERWGTSVEVRELGPGLRLVSGIREACREGDPPASAEADPPGPPIPLAERTLGEARASGDQRRISSALADLGLAYLLAKEVHRAVALIEEAMVVARQAGDRGLEVGAAIDLGIAALVAGRPDRAMVHLESGLQGARAIGDRAAEKAALDRMGQASAALGRLPDALAHFERAIALATDLADVGHEAELLWRAAILHAELGRRDRAITLARSSVHRMERMGRPQATWFARHLELFSSGGGESPTALSPGYVDVPWAGLSSSVDPTTWEPQSISGSQARGPGVLVMALSAASSMARFVGTGFRTADQDTRHGRLEACASCRHHTGLRCRLCGCFTATKARLVHEKCPAGRWPS